MRIDPEGVEIGKVKRHVSFDGKEVLEIGCGEGRLTCQYAALTKHVIAVDPNRSAIADAKKKTPKVIEDKVTFRVMRGEKLSFPSRSFDVVFFGWSLCCADVPAMGVELNEAWRVLRPKGLLVNIQASLHQPFRSGIATYLMDRNSGPTMHNDEEAYSRLALKYASLVEQRFDFVVEEEFPNYTYYDTINEALRNFVSARKERYRMLNQGTKQRIRELVNERGIKTKKGIRMTENAVLTVLRKAGN